MQIPSKSDAPEMFTKIAKRYDLGNHVLSFGLDYLWRKRLFKAVSKQKPVSVLDVATGTGDIAFSLRKIPSVTSITGVDPSEGMLDLAELKLNTKYKEEKERIHFKKGDAQALEMADESFDAVTISFGIRNVPNTEKALQEFFRVLKPQGQLYILEFSMPSNKLFASPYLVYLRKILPHIGGLISGNKTAYSYLNKTIEKFPSGKQFIKILESVGFKKVNLQTMAFGAVTLYTVKKV